MLIKRLPSRSWRGPHQTSSPTEFPSRSSSPPGYGGLDAQIQKINHLLACFNRDFPIPSLKRPRGLLIHGGHGTGKTLILNSLANSGWGTVHRIMFTDKLSQVQETFQKALAERPSLSADR